MKQVIIVDTTDTKNVVAKNAQLKKTPRATVVLAQDKKAVSEALKGNNEVFIFAENIDRRSLKGDDIVVDKTTEDKPKKKSTKKTSKKKK